MRYFLRKAGFYLVALWGAITLNFFLPRLIPGNPVEVLLTRMSQAGSPPPGEYQTLQALLGLGGGNIFSQYWPYLDQLAHLNFGLSITDFPVPVTSILSSALPWTIILVGTATILAFLIGTVLGAAAGWRRSRLLDSLVPAMPYFWLALLLLYLFGVVVKVFPLNGGYDASTTIGFNGAFISSAFLHAILPAATIVLAQIGGWLLSMRNMTLTTLSEDYVVAAEAKGLAPRRVLVGYAARNAVLPSFTSFAISIGFVVSGSIIMEIVFSYPRIGYGRFQAGRRGNSAPAEGL